MESQKYKVHKIEELEIKPTGKTFAFTNKEHKKIRVKVFGETFNIKGRLFPFGTPLFAIYSLDGKEVYPNHPVIRDGEPKENCERWTKENCWFPEDKPFKINLLEKLIKLGPDEELDNIKVIQNKLIYEGNRHNDFNLIFQEINNHYQFNYIQDELDCLHIGRWMGPSLQISQDEYLCRRVYPHERIITITDFLREK